MKITKGITINQTFKSIGVNFWVLCYVFFFLFFLGKTNKIYSQSGSTPSGLSVNCSPIFTLYQTEGRVIGNPVDPINTSGPRVLRYNPFLREYVQVGNLTGSENGPAVNRPLGNASNSAFNAVTNLVYSASGNRLRAFDPNNNFQYVGSIQLNNTGSITTNFTNVLFGENEYIGWINGGVLNRINVDNITFSNPGPTVIATAGNPDVISVTVTNQNPLNGVGVPSPGLPNVADYSYSGNYVFGTTSGRLVAIAIADDLANGVSAGDAVTRNITYTSAVTGGNASPTGGFGAAWRDRNGNFYAFNNNNGNIYRIKDIENEFLATNAPTDILNAEAVLVATPSGTNDGFACEIQVNPLDFDGDNVEDVIDIDDDNDGILDVIENGGPDPNFIDADMDGVPALIDDDETNPAIGNDDGLINAIYDFDGDQIPNAFDLDSDNDGIPDNIEAQATLSYVAPGGNDANGNGFLDIYEVGATGAPNYTLANTDGLTQPDYLDIDSDGDGILDVVEGRDANQDGIADILFQPIDFDGDGIVDVFDLQPEGPANGDAASNNMQTPFSFTDLNPVGGEPNWRESVDSDGDGVPNVLDVDDDNDGILDTVECTVNAPLARVSGGNDVPLVYSLSGTNPLVSLDVTTDTGAFGFGLANRFNMNETSTGQGTYTIDFSENVQEITLYATSIGTNNTGVLNTSIVGITFSGQALFGNFTATLENNTVLSNLIPDIDFDASGGSLPDYQIQDGEIATTTVINGITYVTDPTSNSTQASGVIRFPELVGLNVKQLTFDHIGDGIGPSLFLGIEANVCSDTDGDGIPNFLDLDSDGDGCPDAVEGDGSPRLADLVPATGTILNLAYNNNNDGSISMGYLGTSTQSVIDNLGDTVDTNPASPTYGSPVGGTPATAIIQGVGGSVDVNDTSGCCEIVAPIVGP